MKRIITLTAAALVTVALVPAAFAERTIITFPSPVRAQVGEILNTSGRGMVMKLDDFCELNKKQIVYLKQDCSMDTWIQKNQVVSIRL